MCGHAVSGAQRRTGLGRQACRIKRIENVLSRGPLCATWNASVKRTMSNPKRKGGDFTCANSVEVLLGSRHAAILPVVNNAARERDSCVRAPIRDVVPDVPHCISEAE